MKLFRTEEFVKREIVSPEQVHRKEILTNEDQAQELGGLFVVTPPGYKGRGRGHYHERRESLFMALSGEGSVFIEGEEIPIKAGDILFIPPKVVHTMVNKSDKDLRFMEFFTHPPAKADFHEVD